MKDEDNTKEQLITELAELRQRITGLELSEARRQRAEERIEHLNLVLRAIRNVNQLITREQDRDHLLKGACENLIETRGYHNAWTAILDESGRLVTNAEAGLGRDFLPLVERLRRGELITCVRQALSQSGVVVTKDPLSTCTDCPLADKYAGRGAMIVRLEYGGKVYGLLVASIPAEFVEDAEEQSMFQEVASAIAFALHDIELEEKRKQAEDKLEESEEQYRTLVETSNDMIIKTDLQGNLLFVNSAVERTLGYSVEESKKIKGLELVHPEDKKAAREQFAQLLKGVRMSNIEYRLRTKEGSYVSVLSNLTSLLDAQGKAVALQGISRDITERKQAEEEIRRRHRELTALHNVLLAITQSLELEEVLKEIVSQVGAALNSEYTSIVLVNQDGSLGVSSESFVDRQPLAERARPQGVTRRIIATGEQVVIDDVDADEGTNPILVAAGIKSYAGAPIKVKDTVTGVLFVHSMQRKTFAGSMELLIAFAHQAAIAIENARLYEEASTVGALREADRLKSELLANVSHELRTPLSSIKGFSTALLGYYGKLSKKQKLDMLNEIDQASDSLTELIENLLELSRLEAGMFPIQREPLDPAPIISKALENMQQKAAKHRFVSSLAEPLPLVEADPRRIRQVMDNLLDNAVKYSPEGTEISVRCELRQRVLIVSVRDQGIGISPEEMDRIFAHFYQAEPELLAKNPGAGLGLAICKGIIEAHGGHIWAESRSGQGSTFIFTLPLLAQENAEDIGKS